MVGTSPHAHLRLDDPYVSGEHLAVELQGGQVIVHDLASKNGTYVAGTRIDGARLSPGSQLRLGTTTLELRTHRPGRGFHRLIGQSPALCKAIATARRAARSDCRVLILGETGTGKELLARAIHESSPRAGGPFVALNCGALPRELVASELFGHVRGAFTGATGDRPGVFRRASGGTLFLDELGELPLEQQVHLLRVLETGVVVPVGSSDEHTVDVRLVAATNATGIGTEGSQFRADLYHRLATVVVELPALRSRPEDIPLLVEHFMAELAGRYGPRTIGPETLELLGRLYWAGNIRELRQAVHRAMALSTGPLSFDVLVPPKMRRWALGADAEQAPLLPLDQAARDLMSSAYRQHGSIRRAARALGIPKSTFADRARRYGIVGK
jgi:DNA-binding NtrC family response regulator